MKTGLLVQVVWALSAPALGYVGPNRLEAGLIGRDDILLFCDFEDAGRQELFAGRRKPGLNSIVEGEAALGGSGRSLRITVPRGVHAGGGARPKGLKHRGTCLGLRDKASADKDGAGSKLVTLSPCRLAHLFRGAPAAPLGLRRSAGRLSCSRPAFRRVSRAAGRRRDRPARPMRMPWPARCA